MGDIGIVIDKGFEGYLDLLVRSQGILIGVRAQLIGSIDLSPAKAKMA